MAPREQPEFARLVELVEAAMDEGDVIDQSFRAAEERFGEAYLVHHRKAAGDRPTRRAAKEADRYRQEVIGRALVALGQRWIEEAKA